MALSNFSFCAASLGPKMARLGLFLPLKTAMTVKPRPSEPVLGQEQDRDAGAAQGMMPGALMLHSSPGTARGQPGHLAGGAVAVPQQGCEWQCLQSNKMGEKQLEPLPRRRCWNRLLAGEGERQRWGDVSPAQPGTC